MSEEAALTMDFSEAEATAKVLPCLPVLSSHRSGWKNIHLNHFQMPPWEVGELVPQQHTLTLFSPKAPAEMEMITAGKLCLLPPFEKNHLLLIPNELPFVSRWGSEIDILTCHLDPQFLGRIAHESIDPDLVELRIVLPPTCDPLVWQIILALQHVLETDPDNSGFYAESMATALAAHLIQHYATRKQTLKEYTGGLPQHKLKQAVEYINEHLSENVSLDAISAELGISQYYLCRLFKQSIGITPHAYLIQQRVERSKQLLKAKEGRILDIAIACGFANPSHFARCFRRQIGISPKEFQIR